MKNLSLISRYLVFGLLVICHAIICSVAVWNLSLTQPASQNVQVAEYLTFLGTFALIFMFIIIFIEILRKNAVAGRLWFEASWVGLFWVMELSGSAALTAAAPSVLWIHQDSLFDGDARTSTRVLLAFSWMTTTILLVYLLVLACTAIIRQKEDPEIWHASVRDVCQSATKFSLGSRPNSPTLPRFNKPVVDVFAPQPRRPVAPVFYSQRSGINPEYDIEHYHPSNQAAERPMPPIPAAAPPQHLRQSTRSAAVLPTVTAPSFYPQHIHSSITPRQTMQQTSVSPPPLGNWPRANAVDQPLSSKRRPQLAVTTSFGTNGVASATPTSSAIPTANSSSPPRASRPSGPRTKSRSSSGEAHRPPPLDLARISAFRD